ncbi:hypothetical protein [Dactylosporangium sp. CA-092794]|uniref:hypothetical protein n=1 Tax=Dactylosporangium sp. CA-092794 TaxID=3239929 RepID=UPI003D8A750B
MTAPILLALAVGEAVPLPGARTVAAAARAAGVAALRLLDGPPGHTLDPTVVAGYLGGAVPGLGLVAEIPTTHHAPYNTARRVLSLDRAGGGRTGIALRAGGGDEVSDVTAADPQATGPARRWQEYARVLTGLWESFPRSALLGDQAAGIVADDALIAPIGHEGACYRVAGPLDGPSSVQGRPVLVADLGALDAAAVAESADVVVAGRDRAEGAHAELTAALQAAGRSRREVALLGRVEIAEGSRVSAAELRAWAGRDSLDGFELVPAGGAAAVLEVLRTLVPRLGGPRRAGTLRAALGLPAVRS